jgi:hypothetical protein
MVCWPTVRRVPGRSSAAGAMPAAPATGLDQPSETDPLRVLLRPSAQGTKRRMMGVTDHGTLRQRNIHLLSSDTASDLVVCRGFGDPVEGGLSASDFVEDLVGGFGPDELGADEAGSADHNDLHDASPSVVGFSSVAAGLPAAVTSVGSLIRARVSQTGADAMELAVSTPRSDAPTSALDGTLLAHSSFTNEAER